MSVIATQSGSIEYVAWVAPTCDANTPEGGYTLTAVPISTVMLWRLEVRVPAGHQGLTGIALVDSGTFIIPYSSAGPAWVIGDNDLLEYPYNKQLGDNVVLATYNTDETYNHSWQVRLVYTPVAAVEEGGPIVVTSASEAQVAAAGG